MGKRKRISFEKGSMTILTEIASCMIMNHPIKIDEIGIVDVDLFLTMRDRIGSTIRAGVLLQLQTDVIMKRRILFKCFAGLDILGMNIKQGCDKIGLWNHCIPPSCFLLATNFKVTRSFLFTYTKSYRAPTLNFIESPH